MINFKLPLVIFGLFFKSIVSDFVAELRLDGLIRYCGGDWKDRLELEDPCLLLAWLRWTKLEFKNRTCFIGRALLLCLFN